MLLHNAARGEIPVTIGEVDLVLAAELGRVATLASVLGVSDWGALVEKILIGTPAQIRHGIEVLAVRGNVEKAIDRFQDDDLIALQEAVRAVLTAHIPAGGGRKSTSKKAANFSWVEWQEVAYGGLRWTPQTFWGSTLVEFFAANEGLALAKGLRKKVAPPSRERLEELKKKYA